jgi:hypothetical protein
MRPQTPLKTVSSVILACTVVALGCGDATTGPDPDVNTGPVDVSVVSSVDMVMAVGRSAQMNATVTNGYGAVVSNASLSWESSDDQVATVTGSGLVTGVSAGQASVTARHDGMAGSVALTIIDANLEGIAELRNDPLVTMLVDRLSGELTLELTAAFSDLDDAITIGNCLAVRDALQAALTGTGGSADPSDVITLTVIGLVLEQANILLGLR